jgi:hypothetical protein
MEYSPGPWRKSEQEDVWFDADGKSIFDWGISVECELGNKQLITYSVEMYETLQKIMSFDPTKGGIMQALARRTLHPMEQD